MNHFYCILNNLGLYCLSVVVSPCCSKISSAYEYCIPGSGHNSQTTRQPTAFVAFNTLYRTIYVGTCLFGLLNVNALCPRISIVNHDTTVSACCDVFRIADHFANGKNSDHISGFTEIELENRICHLGHTLLNS